MRNTTNIVAAFCVIVVIGMLALAGGKQWRDTSIVGPDYYLITTYASYEFNVLNHPTGLAQVVDGYGRQHLFIADSANHLVRRFTPSNVNNPLVTIAGTGAAGYVNGANAQSQFNYPTGIVAENYPTLYYDAHQDIMRTTYFQRLYVNDSQNYVIRRLDSCGGPLPCDVNGTPSANETTSTIVGNHTKGMTDGASLSASFASLGGLTKVGTNFYIADAENQAIRKWDGTNVTTIAGTGYPGDADGFGMNAQFYVPSKVTFDNQGNMYIADVENHAIRKMDTAGNISTLAGEKGNPGFSDGKRGSRFFRPTSVVFNPADGMLYVADSHNNCIRRIDMMGVVTIYAGAEQAGYVNGTLANARFSMPTDLVIYAGFMYVSDSLNNSIRRIDMNSGVVTTYIN